MDYSLPGSSIQFSRILQARILEWVAISFSMFYIYIFFKIIIQDRTWEGVSKGRGYMYTYG